jgi:cytochrome c peroxidase
VVSVTRDGRGTLNILDNVGTFNAASVIEIRGAGAVAGQSTQGFAPFGAAGFNTPSLLGVAYSAPYFHDGSARTLEEVAARHSLLVSGTFTETFSPQELDELLSFVRSIDDETPTIASSTDEFIQ